MLHSSYGRLNLCKVSDDHHLESKVTHPCPDPASYPPEPYPPTDPVELKIQSVLKTNYECTYRFKSNYLVT